MVGVAHVSPAAQTNWGTIPRALQVQSKVILGKLVEKGLSGTAAVLGFVATAQDITGCSLTHCPGALRHGGFPGLPDRASNRIRGSLPGHPILIPLGGEKSGWDKRH